MKALMSLQYGSMSGDGEQLQPIRFHFEIFFSHPTITGFDNGAATVQNATPTHTTTFLTCFGGWKPVKPVSRLLINSSNTSRVFGTNLVPTTMTDHTHSDPNTVADLSRELATLMAVAAFLGKHNYNIH